MSSVLPINADAALIPLADGKVHCCVTSPPYWGLRKYAGDMARVWGGRADCVHEWGEEQIATNSGGGWNDPEKRSNYPTMRLRDPDKETQQEVSQGQFCRLCGAWYGELGLEPTPDLYVQHMVEIFREVKRVLRDDGTCWLNLGDSYAGSGGPGSQYDNKAAPKYKDKFTYYSNPNRSVPNLKPKDMVGIPWAVAFALRADGWWLRSDIIWSKPNTMPESVTDRPTKAHEYVFLLTKSARYYYDSDAIREEAAESTLERDQYRRTGFAKERAHDKYINHLNPNTSEFLDHSSGRNRRTVWQIATAPYSGAHFATFPPALVEPCIKAGTSERGVCPECGKPWERVTSKDVYLEPGRKQLGLGTKTLDNPMTNNGKQGSTLHHVREQTTTGWRATCDHDAEPVPAIVLDPFAGSGTTLMVARQLGRHGVGLDLSFPYLRDQARERLSLKALDEWLHGKKDGARVDDLPLFREPQHE